MSFSPEGDYLLYIIPPQFAVVPSEVGPVEQATPTDSPLCRRNPYRFGCPGTLEEPATTYRRTAAGQLRSLHLESGESFPIYTESLSPLEIEGDDRRFQRGIRDVERSFPPTGWSPDGTKILVYPEYLSGFLSASPRREKMRVLSPRGEVQHEPFAVTDEQALSTSFFWSKKSGLLHFYSIEDISEEQPYGITHQNIVKMDGSSRRIISDIGLPRRVNFFGAIPDRAGFLSQNEGWALVYTYAEQQDGEKQPQFHSYNVEAEKHHLLSDKPTSCGAN